MRARRENLFHLLEPLLPHVEHPARYLDHEWGSCQDQEGPFHLCMVYADVYEVGQPNLGVSILYERVNAEEGMSCERCYLPWKDMAGLMRAHGVPLLSLEGAAPLASFDAIGFTLAHELIATNVLETLDLAGIALTAEERDEDDPIVLAGGPSAWNCEPVAAVFDAVLLGDGEESIVEVCACIRDARAEGVPRAELLRRLARAPGTYVPSLYEVVVDETTTRWGRAVPRAGEGAPEVVLKRCIPDLSETPAVAQRIVPYMGIVQDRLSLEVLRGCARGCRFCQAGMTYRPVRERPAEQVVSCGVEGLLASGHNEVSLTSLSTTDHSQCARILNEMNGRLEGRGIRISIPSQRLDSFGVEMAAAVAGGKRGGLTFAPEAGSQRLRDVINKNVTEEDLERAARNAFEQGWRRMKLYFMMGLPTETDEDVVGIARLAERVLEIGREVVGRGAKSGVSVSISVAVLVPKAFTPFQWEGQLAPDEVRRRQQLLLSEVRDRAIRVSYHGASVSLVEGALSKMGRAGFGLVRAAWERGARFDAWTSEFSIDVWERAAEACGLDLVDVACERFPLTARLPWEHTSPGVSTGYLQREWRRAAEGVTTPDCTRASCTGCGVCPTLGVQNKIQEVRA
ncbi:TIGR03960 family B12-binding radical SAM protein [Olsenella sp. An290]|uniref:TIGR03960 family B12-binding radical SAM protein n=1 Tax=Olsenella sp. An290 TaxID=1965625 RepID=UPI000B366E2C|nr:TIGR03960 family B12-binding radical SAM protein [Olsenella sp. An290]OUO34921.1 B12-binding domain-containing radical SAM protein [Olsenella sp. An290]